MKFEYSGITPEFNPYKTTIEIVSVDNENAILHCRSADGQEKKMTFEIFNRYLQTQQFKLIS